MLRFFSIQPLDAGTGKKSLHGVVLGIISLLRPYEPEFNHMAIPHFKEAGNINYLCVQKEEEDCVLVNKHPISIINTNKQNQRKLNTNGQYTYEIIFSLIPVLQN